MGMSPPSEHEGAAPSSPSKSPRTVALILGVVGCGLLVGCGVLGVAVLLPVFAQAREAAWTNRCMGNLRRLSQASLMYAVDHDERLPGRQWMDSLRGHIRSQSVSWRCPKVRSENADDYGYAFAEDAVGKRMPSFAIPSKQPLIFDSKLLGRNAVASVQSEPSPGRHRRSGDSGKSGNNVAYLTGGVMFVSDPAAK